MFDVLIRDGLVVDGTGSPRLRADIAIEGDRIAAVGALPAATARRVIEASGKIVCPGFVDPHSHSDFTILTNPTAESTIRQGVTTEIVGNCGWTHAPIGAPSREAVRANLRRYCYDGPIEWESSADYLRFVADMRTSQNLAWLVGHNTVRQAAGVVGAKATDEQLETMRDLVREAMHAGAFGLSSGLEFAPGSSAPTEEVVELAGVVAEYGGYYASHIRNRDASLLPAVEEFLSILHASGANGQLSHLNVRHNTGAPPDGWQRAVGLLADARASGLNVLADTTPFRDGLGQMAGILPAWVLADGAEVAARRLTDVTVRERLKHECDRYWRFIHRGEWDRVRLIGNATHPQYAGMTFREIAAAEGRDPWDCYFDILAAAGPALEGTMVMGVLFTEEHVAEMARHPLFCLGVDAYTSRIDGPLSELTQHPLFYAGTVHYLTHQVRERHTLSLEGAIRKMTGMPAGHFGLAGRGLLRRGFAADVVVLDDERLEDVSTAAQPHAYAKGIDQVLVNGVVVVDSGAHTGARPGRVLARS